jgi:hypothetical protein
VDGLPRQVPGERLDPAPGLAGGVRDAPAQRGVRHVLREPPDDAIGVPQVPLQHAIEPGVDEVAQRPAHLAGHRADLRDDPRGQVAGAGEGAAGQVRQHPGEGGPVPGRHGHRPGSHGPGAQPAGRGDVLRRGVLRLDLGRGEHRVRDLEHAENTVVRFHQQKVAVLLTTQRPRPHFEAERGGCEPFGLFDRHQRYGERAVAEEIDPWRRPCIRA